MAYLWQRGDTWYVIDKNVRPSWIKLGRSKDGIDDATAKRILARYQKDANYQRLHWRPAQAMTWEAAEREYFQWAAQHKAPRTLNTERHLLSMLQKRIGGKTPLHTVTAAQLSAVVTGGPNYRRLQIAALSSLFGYALRHGVVQVNVVKEVPRPRLPVSVPKHADPAVLQQIFAQLPAELRPRYQLLYYTGMRPSEVLQLRVRDVRTKEGVIVVAKTKTARYRTIPMSEIVRGLCRQLTKGKGVDDWLCPSVHGGPCKNLYRAWRAACQRAGVANIWPYMLRHTFGTQVVNNVEHPNALRTAQQLMGHRDIATTTRYAWALDPQLRAGVDAVK